MLSCCCREGPAELLGCPCTGLGVRKRVCQQTQALICKVSQSSLVQSCSASTQRLSVSLLKRAATLFNSLIDRFWVEVAPCSWEGASLYLPGACPEDRSALTATHLPVALPWICRTPERVVVHFQ